MGATGGTVSTGGGAGGVGATESGSFPHEATDKIENNTHPKKIRFIITYLFLPCTASNNCVVYRLRDA